VKICNGYEFYGGGANAGSEKKGSGGSAASGSAGPGSSSHLAAGDMEKLREAVQLLVQHTRPLGTCMDFVQDDVSIMTSELARWEQECRK